MEQNVEIKKPVPNPRDMAAGEIVVNVQKTDENGVTIKLWPDVGAVRNHMNDLVSLVPCDTYSVRHYTCGRYMYCAIALDDATRDAPCPAAYRVHSDSATNESDCGCLGHRCRGVRPAAAAHPVQQGAHRPPGQARHQHH